MKFVAKVFKNGDSLAVQLPAALNVKTDELCIEQGRDGDIVLYDEKEREQAWRKRQQAFQELVKSIREDAQENGYLEEEMVQRV